VFEAIQCKEKDFLSGSKQFNSEVAKLAKAVSTLVSNDDEAKAKLLEFEGGGQLADSLPVIVETPEEVDYPWLESLEDSPPAPSSLDDSHAMAAAVQSGKTLQPNPCHGQAVVCHDALCEPTFVGAAGARKQEWAAGQCPPPTSTQGAEMPRLGGRDISTVTTCASLSGLPSSSDTSNSSRAGQQHLQRLDSPEGGAQGWPRQLFAPQIESLPRTSPPMQPSCGSPAPPAFKDESESQSTWIRLDVIPHEQPRCSSTDDELPSFPPVNTAKARLRKLPLRQIGDASLTSKASPDDPLVVPSDDEPKCKPGNPRAAVKSSDTSHQSADDDPVVGGWN